MQGIELNLLRTVKWLVSSNLMLNLEERHLLDYYIAKAKFALCSDAICITHYMPQIMQYLRSIVTLRPCDYDPDTQTLTDYGLDNLKSVTLETDFRVFLMHLNFELRQLGYEGSRQIQARECDEVCYETTLFMATPNCETTRLLAALAGN